MLGRVCRITTLKCLEYIQQNNFQFPELLSHHLFQDFRDIFMSYEDGREPEHIRFLR